MMGDEKKEESGAKMKSEEQFFLYMFIHTSANKDCTKYA